MITKDKFLQNEFEISLDFQFLTLVEVKGLIKFCKMKFGIFLDFQFLTLLEVKGLIKCQLR